MEKTTLLNSDSQLTFKQEGESGAFQFEGYGAFFGNVDSYNDIIAQGAFKGSIGTGIDFPKMLFNHNRS